MVCDIASIEFGEGSLCFGDGSERDIKFIKNYYVLVILMAGVIDDFQEALNEILRAAHLPVSVEIIKIGSGGINDDNDSTNLQILSEKTFRDCERNFIDITEFDGYKREGLTTQLLL
jgi:hypothetical protein